MKKSQLRKTIRESIKELMTEQSGPDKWYRLVRCDGGGTFPLFCHKSSNPPLQIGDTLQMGVSSIPTGTNWFVSSGPLFGGCTWQQGWGEPESYNLVPCATCCGGCNPCATNPNGSCNPSAWSNHANWTSTFTNTVTNHNNPCNFLNNKIAQFTANLQGTGGGNFQNMLNCKLDLATQLHTSNNC